MAAFAHSGNDNTPLDAEHQIDGIENGTGKRPVKGSHHSLDTAHTSPQTIANRYYRIVRVARTDNRSGHWQTRQIGSLRAACSMFLPPEKIGMEL